MRCQTASDETRLSAAIRLIPDIPLVCPVPRYRECADALFSTSGRLFHRRNPLPGSPCISNRHLSLPPIFTKRIAHDNVLPHGV